MGAIGALAAVCSIALVTAIMVVVVDPAFAVERVPGGGGGGGVRGAPGPIAGTGLVTVVIGAGAYWLFRRFRKTR
jgi:hypothetical protein